MAIYPGVATEWTVVDTSSGDEDEVTCTKDAEDDKAHFITFVSASSDNSTTVAGGAIKARLREGVAGTIRLEFWVGELLDTGPNVIVFPAPIKMKVGTAALWHSAMTASGSDQVTFTMGGFTR